MSDFINCGYHSQIRKSMTYDEIAEVFRPDREIEYESKGIFSDKVPVSSKIIHSKLVKDTIGKVFMFITADRHHYYIRHDEGSNECHGGNYLEYGSLRLRFAKVEWICEGVRNKNMYMSDDCTKLRFSDYLGNTVVEIKIYSIIRDNNDM